MRRTNRFIPITVGSIIALLMVLVFIDSIDWKGEEKVLPSVEHKDVFQNSRISRFPSRLRVEGNKIVNASGETIILKGLMAPDPRDVAFKDNFTEPYYKKIFEAGGKQQYLVGDRNSFGEPLLKYLEERDIGWIACWYDDVWEPPLFTKDYGGTTNYGRFVFDKLK